MPVSPFSGLGPPVAKVLPMRDFEEGTKLFNSWQGKFEQLSNGQFEGRLDVVRSSLVRLIRVVANQRVLIRGHDTEGLFSIYLVTNSNVGDLWQGYRLAPGHLILNGVQTEIDHCSGRRTETIGLSLRPESLQRAAQSLLAIEEVVLPKTWASVSPPPDAIDHLNGQIGRLFALGIESPTILGTTECGEWEQECVRSLVNAIFPFDSRRDSLPLPARTEIVRHAEELMRANFREPIGAIDLCRQLRVSDRTLRLAFRERFGLGPMAYYRCIRLNDVRVRLRQSSLLSVAEAAVASGFHHLGNFAADYRRLFGVRPSATPRPQSGSSETNGADSSF